MNDAPSAFWDFSLRFYAEPGVAAACLELQDAGGADINVVLYLFFLATQNRQLDGNDVARLDAAVAAWRDEVVRPLRALRRHLKTATPPFAGTATTGLRDGIKRSELAAERIQQLTIEQQFPAASFGTAAASRADAVRTSLAAYAGLTGALPAGAAGRMIETFTRLQ